ncbi:MAG: hypothetical protein ACWGNV_06755, partial [Bacteroidales bacterium]
RKDAEIAGIVFHVRGHHVNLFWLMMKPVELQLLKRPGGNDKHTGEAKGKTKQTEKMMPEDGEEFLHVHGS